MDKLIAGNLADGLLTDLQLLTHPINKSPEKARVNKNSKINRKSPQANNHEPEIEDDLLKEI